MSRRGSPTAAQIQAVHQVLYDHKRMQRLANLSNNIQLSMNLSAEVEIGPDDPRGPAGSGPQWYIPATGALDPSVIAAAGYCDEIATTLKQIAHGISQVDLPKADKKHLIAGINAGAALCTARGRVWRASGDPGDPNSAATTISKHTQEMVQHLKHVKRYLEPASEARR